MFNFKDFFTCSIHLFYNNMIIFYYSKVYIFLNNYSILIMKNNRKIIVFPLENK